MWHKFDMTDDTARAMDRLYCKATSRASKQRRPDKLNARAIARCDRDAIRETQTEER